MWLIHWLVFLNMNLVNVLRQCEEEVLTIGRPDRIYIAAGIYSTQLPAWRHFPAVVLESNPPLKQWLTTCSLSLHHKPFTVPSLVSRAMVTHIGQPFCFIWCLSCSLSLSVMLPLWYTVMFMLKRSNCITLHINESQAFCLAMSSLSWFEPLWCLISDYAGIIKWICEKLCTCAGHLSIEMNCIL